MRYYFITGERSGDLHASNLAKAIRRKDPKAEFRGVGGDHLKECGATFLFSYKFLSFMGFFETLIRLRRFLKAIRAVKADILAFKADAVIFVDFAAFNMRIVPFVVQKGIESFYYISPKVWAWNTGRAKKIKKWVKHMFVILPFEKPFYQQFDYDVYYVGNPVKDAIRDFNGPPLRQELKIIDSAKVVALLPGSRKQEVQHSTSVFAQIAKRNPDVRFIVAAVNNLDLSMYREFEKLSNVDVLVDRNYDVLSAADAALVTSGTATLETALFGVPQAVVYRTSKFSYFVAKSLIRVDHISLVNLIADRAVVREIIQDDFNADTVENEMKSLLYDENRLQQIRSDYKEIDIILGEISPSEVVSDNIIKLISEK